MKKTYRFTLPQNKEVENTNVRVENGEVFVDVKLKEKFQPKDGDFLISSKGGIFIYDGKTQEDSYGCYFGVNTCGYIQFANLGFDGGWTKKKGCRYATELEKNIFLERLEKECGKRWNAENKCLEDIRWRASMSKTFYYVDMHGRACSRIDGRDEYSNSLYEANNYFRTSESAQKVADQIKEIFKNSTVE